MKKFIKNLLICICIVFITFILTSILVELISTTQISDQISEMEVEKSTGWKNASCNDKYIKITKQIEDGGIWRPVIDSNIGVAYCIEPGTSLEMWNDERKIYKTSRETIYSYKDGEKISSCKCAEEVPHFGERSATYLVCNNKHYTESDSYNGERRTTAEDNITKLVHYDDLYDVGYILSYQYDQTKYEEGETWEASKQQAIWHSSISEVEQVKSTQHTEEGIQIVNGAKEYQTFIREVKLNNDNMIKKDNTDIDNIEFDTDSQTKLHKLGPFNIDYIPGKEVNGSYAYGGISDMYLTDKNGKRIDIENFIRPSRNSQKDEVEKNHVIYSSHMKPKFFTTKYEGKENANKVDYFAYMSCYPDPNEDFFVEFNYEGDISYLELHVEFSHLECKAEFCIREGTYWEVGEYEHDHTYNNPHSHYTCGKTEHSHSENCYNKEGRPRMYKRTFTYR